MFEYSHSIETDATPAAIFALYSDVATWPQWDAGVERMELSGPFAPGTHGTMKNAGQDPLPITITAVRPDAGFDDETHIPDAGVVIAFFHDLTPLPDGRTRITHRVSITGPAAAAVGPQIGPMITAGIPDTMAALAKLARA